ncbi:MAG: (d)CMP kinase [Bacteroidia bacterium]
MTKITIAIDGYSSCGKSTLAKALASKLGYAYVDSGAMYRCVTLYALRKGVIKDHSFHEGDILKLLDEINLSFKFNPSTKSSETFLNGENVEKDIRQMVVSENVSKVSAIHDVRVKMIAIQRDLGKNKGIVMDGRDIGTNVFPDAELKLFMTADTDVRTQRRFDEFSSKGQHISFNDVKLNLIQRDYEDTHRKENPLTQADDAIVLDNTDLTREQQLEYVIKLITDLTLSVN